MSEEFTSAEKASMEALAMKMVRDVNEALPAMRSKGACIHAVLVGCAATLQNFCPPGMHRDTHNAFADQCADTLIEQIVSMYGK